ncbi:MAG: DUF3883 domain-containing protein, partial [Chloroflexota bacterium]|nr:DUF3883 domain-containing protein [Chloroflexota bacterium]
LVVPVGMLAGLDLPAADDACPDAAARARVEWLAMEAVMAAERGLGFLPRDVSAGKVGYDIESAPPDGGPLRFLEVKGRMAGADTVTLTKNEILTALNQPEQFILALVAVDDVGAGPPRYVRLPFKREPDFGVTSVNYDLPALLARGHAPA